MSGVGNDIHWELPGAGTRPRGSGSPPRLGALLEPVGVILDSEVAEIPISSIAYDSREVSAGCLFVAVRGLTTDGHLYLSEAVSRGAVAALVEETAGIDGLSEIVVPDSRHALGLVSHEFYGRPSERLKTHGITGTNGKTTTSYLLDSILREAGSTTGVVGTLGYRVVDRTTAGDMTSPESLDLARLLASMVDAGVSAVTMEVSSHALALGRTAGTKFDTATFTNISRDHLDFHGSFEEYAGAKRRLFEHIASDGWKPGATAVINASEELGRELIEFVRVLPNLRLVTYGARDADVAVEESVSTSAGTTARFRTPDAAFDVTLRLISGFNVTNALAAAAVAFSQDLSIDAIAAGLSRVERIEGRLETVEAGQDFTIVVDYAHTPDALEQTLAALRALEPSRLIVVFGCGGDRDRGKRPLMGEIAVAGADLVFVTSDNPRTEDPARIIAEIVDGTTGAAGGRVEVVPDRRGAIGLAVSEARAGDIVLIAGKGHEGYQIVGTEKLRFDDREEARAAVAGRGSHRGEDGEGKAV